MTKLNFAGVLLIVGCAQMAFAGDDLNTNVDLHGTDDSKLVVSGAHLRNLGNSTFEVTLNTRLGLNSCLAQGVAPKIDVVEDAEARETTIRVLRAGEEPSHYCEEQYFPVFEDISFEVTQKAGYTLILDTSSEELGTVALVGGDHKTVIETFEVKERNEVYGDKAWSAARITARALQGSDSCDASSHALKGFAYTVDDALHLAVARMSKEPARCAFASGPVFSSVEVLGVYLPAQVKALKVENWKSQGEVAEFSLPEILR